MKSDANRKSSNNTKPKDTKEVDDGVEDEEDDEEHDPAKANKNNDLGHHNGSIDRSDKSSNFSNHHV
jgi:hypothetical protein